MLNDLLSDRKISHQKQHPSSPQNSNEFNYAMLFQANKQNSQMLSSLYINEHEKYLQDLKTKQQKILKPYQSQRSSQMQSPQFDGLMNKLKVLLINKKAVNMNVQHDSSTSDNDEEDYTDKGSHCKQCKKVEAQLIHKKSVKQTKTQSHLNDLSKLVKQSSGLVQMFQNKFGTLDKMEQLWTEGKHIKLINKLIKLMSQMLNKLINVKIDDVLVSSRSNECVDQARFQTPPLAQPQFQEFNLVQSPRFNDDHASQYYYAQKVQSPQNATVSHFPILGKKYISQEMDYRRTSSSNVQDNRSSTELNTLGQQEGLKRPSFNSSSKLMVFSSIDDLQKKVDLIGNPPKLKHGQSTASQISTSMDKKNFLRGNHSSPYKKKKDNTSTSSTRQS